MKKYICLLVIITMALFLQECKKETEEHPVRVQTVVGEVKLHTKLGKTQLQAGDILTKGDRVVTSKGSIVDIIFGSVGLIRVLENTSISVAEIINKTNNHGQLDMKEGKVLATLSKLKKNSFTIKTHTLTASVRGTSFVVTAEKNKARLDVIKGKVAVNPVLNGKVIEKVEKIVEKNKSVQLNEKDIKDIIEGKKEIRVIPIDGDVFKSIEKEVKETWDSFTKQSGPDMHTEIQNEMKDIMQDFLGDQDSNDQKDSDNTDDTDENETDVDGIENNSTDKKSKDKKEEKGDAINSFLENKDPDNDDE